MWASGVLGASLLQVEGSRGGWGAGVRGGGWGLGGRGGKYQWLHCKLRQEGQRALEGPSSHSFSLSLVSSGRSDQARSNQV